MPNTEYSEEINELFQRIIDKPFNLNVRIQETRIGPLSEPFFFFLLMLTTVVWLMAAGHQLAIFSVNRKGPLTHGKSGKFRQFR